MIAVAPSILPTLAEAGLPVFLMSAAKPAVSLAALLAYFNLVTVRLLPDAQMYQTYKLSPSKWSGMFLGFGAAALAAVLLVPTWFGGFPAMLALLAAPCALYVRERTAKLAGTNVKPMLLLAIDFSKRSADRHAKAARAASSSPATPTPCPGTARPGRWTRCPAK